MFSSTSFAPLYAERFLGDEGHQPVETGDLRRSFESFSHSQPSSKRHSSSQETPDFPRTGSKGSKGSKATGSSDDTPTSITSSDDFMEEKFDDENIYVRRMDGSNHTNNNHSTRRSSSTQRNSLRSSSSSSKPEQQLLQVQAPPHDELAQRDLHIKKLMKKLDKMQKRVVDLEVDMQCQDLRFSKHTEEGIELQRTLGTDDKLGIEIGGPAEISSSSEEEKQQEPSRRKSSSTTKQPPLGPEAKRLIHKLLNDYEDMEQMYKEEKYRHQKTMRSMSQRTRNGSTVTTDAEVMSQVSSHLDPAWDGQAGLNGGVFQPKLQDEMRFSHITQPPVFRSSSGLTGTSVAPDPPELEPRQWNYVDPKIRSFSAQEQQYYHNHTQVAAKDYDNNNDDDEDSDRRSDDLSSRQVNSLIDEDVDSDCKAVTDHNEGRQYLRDIILGVNDGLVSTFLLVAGVRGGGMSSTDILLTAIAGSVAGAVSMCAGEYVATKSQNEVTKGEIATEERHIKEYRTEELTEVSDLLELIGIGGDDRALQKRLIRHYARDPKALLKIMIALELGFLEEEERSPFMAGFVSFWLFLIGALPSVIPFMIPNVHPTTGFIAAGVATCVTLLIVGAVKTWATKGNCLSAAMENLCVAGFGGAVAYGAGALSIMLIDE